LLAHIHDTVSDVIFYLAVEPGEQFRFLSINPAFVTATGLTAERVVGRLVQDVIPAQSLDKVLSNYRKAIAQNRTVRWLEVSPYPTGTRHGEVSISPIFSADGVCTNLIGTVHDVTEQYQAQERIFHAQRLESLGTLVSGLAHDFNNILMVVSGNAGLAQLHKDPAKQLEALQQIENASAHGTALIKQLLIFSRRQQAPRGVAALAPLVEETLALAQATLPKNIDVQTAFDHGVPAILADATQVHQVVLNLITNATQAMAQGGTLTLKVEGRTLDAGSAQPLNVPPGTYAKLTVRDTGTGMSDATLQHIFDPFFTTKEPGVGTGLGLAVVHGIVKSHHGAVTVRSAPGQGSEFNVYFPAHTSG
ncbi:MAG TPA: ATP-binding protein, partial [Polyangiaceae bacterium]|nr:ATP-binding protein [Polyangiaceae bacterium]